MKTPNTTEALSLVIGCLSLYVAVLQLQADENHELNALVDNKPIEKEAPNLTRNRARFQHLQNKNAWAVIGCSHRKDRKNSRASAEKINDRIKEKGFTLSQVVDTEGFKGFQCCYWSCIVNIHKDKNTANKLVHKLKEFEISAYIKQLSRDNMP